MYTFKLQLSDGSPADPRTFSAEKALDELPPLLLAAAGKGNTDAS